jgi:putative membrane protein
MPSERRLHPASVVFALVRHAKELLVPGLIVLLGARSRGDGWELWAMVLIVPYAIAAFWRTLAYRYRFDQSELVIRTGFIFRNERHIPFGRIQNVDSIQNVLHRLLRVTDVSIETAGASESEARLSVVSLDAFQELRRRIFDERGVVSIDPTAIRHEEPVLHLTLREVALCGLVQGRGLVVIGTIFGVLWEAGAIDSLAGRFFGERTAGRGVLTQLVLAVFGQGLPPAGTIWVTLGAFGLFILVVRLFSIGWAIVTLHGFRLSRAGEDLQLQFGLATRIAATVPLRRIQMITVQEGPLHRLFKRASVRVDTAGGEGKDAMQSQRHTIAPLIRKSAVPGLVRTILPDAPVETVWSSVHPRGFRREFTGSAIVAVVIALALSAMLGRWTPALLAVLLVWGWLHARGYIRNLGWALTDSQVLFRSGWLWTYLSIAPLARIQVVGVTESPLDRRHKMARVQVDTAGADSASHPVNIPYLAREVADRLAAVLAAHAGRTAFRW